MLLHSRVGVKRSDFTISECFDSNEPETQGSITITCPEHSEISVDDAVFGANEWGACIITEDDCTEQTKIFEVCDGQVNCTRTFKTLTRTCGYSSMLVLGYSCTRPFKNPATDKPLVRPSDRPRATTDQSLPNNSSSARYPASIPKRTGSRKEGADDLTNVPKQPGSRSTSKDKEEIGLIIGCALASVLTVVFLIIAIVMVIRRLLEKDEKDERDNSQRSSGICGSVCIKIDCLPCFSSPDTPQKNAHDLRMRKKIAIESGIQPDQSKLRVAPIGEESFADQGCALSEGEDAISSSSSSSLYANANEIPPVKSAHHPEKAHLHQQLSGHDEISKHDTLNTPGKKKKGKSRKNPLNIKPSSKKDMDNSNTLPSSSNRNLEPLQNQFLSPVDNDPAQLDNTRSSSQSQEQVKFDAIAIPNTQTKSAC
ncbi:hypothetical protein ElyMa_005700100 [Elysia marginata]|uniref:SUEL-type lectin domain-containing protein n=1 Tax=Elysia marginata TaxID=1093978 RepID=A0AAV4FFN3_9GAST|nr:hypothetical protein ElyMa_005700100 [Elysia marginata]